MTNQPYSHAMELLVALSNLTNAPVFDDIEELDPMTVQVLQAANTALLNSTQPYLPFYKDDIAAPISASDPNGSVPRGK